MNNPYWTYLNPQEIGEDTILLQNLSLMFSEKSYLFNKGSGHNHLNAYSVLISKHSYHIRPIIVNPSKEELLLKKEEEIWDIK